MADDRMAALERVAEAAREWRASDGPLCKTYAALLEALRALDALPAAPQPVGEVVTLALWKWPSGLVGLAVDGSDEDDRWGEHDCWRLGTTTLPLKRDGGEG